MAEPLQRLIDVREGEARPAAQAFAALFGLVAAHSILETARDALFLSKLPPEHLALVYAIVAVVTVAVSELNLRFIRRFGRRNALVFTLLAASYGTSLLHLQEPTPTVLFVLYAWSALLGTLLGVQFWMFAGQIFTVAQGKRLFGPIASGGVAGATVGAGFAALALLYVPTGSLLLVAAAIFLATALFLTTVAADPGEPPRAAMTDGAAPAGEGLVTFLRRQPYVRQLAAFVGLSTAAVLVTDYLFKTVAAASLPPGALGLFFARAYAAFNALALVVQLFVAGRLLRRLGVVPALIVLPTLLLVGGVGTAALGGVLAVAVFARGSDGALRHSLHRVAGELLWMPLSGEARDRGKALLDTVFGRAVQAITAGGLILLSALSMRSPRVLAVVVIALSVGWLYVALRLRRSYLDLFRQALARGTLDASITAELDLAAVETVMEALSSREARRVVAAMELLHEKGRSRIVPGLILYHESAEVLVRALRIIATPGRTDWPPLAERLLGHASEAVRVEALRALARIGNHGALLRALGDESPAVRAHAAFWTARDGVDSPAEDPRIRELLALPGPTGSRAREGLLAAIRDVPEPRFADLVLAVLAADDGRVEVVVRAAEAMTALTDERFVPFLVGALLRREARGAVRDALVKQGDPALDALVRALEDPATDRRLALQLPQSIGRFGSQRAADVLTRQLDGARSGAHRDQVLRGIARAAKGAKVEVDAAAMETEARRALLEHLRLLALAARLDQGRGGAAGELLRGLLGDRTEKALERGFRVLQILHPAEDLRRAHRVLRASDKRLRAQAMEFLDTLTLPYGRASEAHRELREALRVVADDLCDADRVARTAHLLPAAPEGEEDAIAELLRGDEALAAVARHYALAVGANGLVAEVSLGALGALDQPAKAPVGAAPPGPALAEASDGSE